MKSQACAPCAKRKVRCDKEEPCSNCKRRKQDHCTYPEASPFDTIQRLEALVRSLGGDPESDAQHVGGSTKTDLSPAKSRSHLQHNDQETASFTKGKSGDPVIIEEDGQSTYFESCVSSFWFRIVIDFADVHGTPGSVTVKTVV